MAAGVHHLAGTGARSNLLGDRLWDRTDALGRVILDLSDRIAEAVADELLASGRMRPRMFLDVVAPEDLVRGLTRVAGGEAQVDDVAVGPGAVPEGAILEPACEFVLEKMRDCLQADWRQQSAALSTHVDLIGCADVRIVHSGAHALHGFDSDLADMLVERYRSIGIDVVLNARVNAVEGEPGRLVMTTASGTFEEDMAVHTAGRVPDVENLGLEAADVRYDRHGVAVDETMRSITNPRFFAAGDAASIGLPLTPVASRQGGIAARNILGESAAFDGTATPSVVFGDPPLACVGMREADLGDHAGDVDVVFNDMSSWFTSRRLGQTHSGSKVLVDKRSGLILGAHVLGAGAEEIISLFALAMRHGIKRDELRQLLTDYPTVSSDVQYMV